MKQIKAIVVSVIAAILQLAAIQSVKADDLFKAFLATICISTNQDGQLVYQRFGNKELIKECAADQGITNLNGLSLAFNLTSNAVQVVSGTNQTLVCTPLTFMNLTSLSGTNKVELIAGVLV